MHNMSKRQLIENYIVQIDKPFSAKEISTITGVPYSTVSENITRFKKQGRIKPINGSKTPRFFRYIRNSKSAKQIEPLSFTPELDKLRIIYDKIELHPRIADLVKTVTFSQTTVWRYIKILLNDNCIMKHKGRYYQRVFNPTGKTFDQYPRMSRNYKRPELIHDLEKICLKGNFDLPDVKDFTNAEIIKLSEEYQVKITIELINKGESSNESSSRSSN